MAGRRVGVRAGGEPKAGQSIHGHRERAAVSSVYHKNSHSLHVRPRPSLGTA